MENKPFWKSKTLWFSLLWGLVAVAGLFGYADFSPGNDVVEIVNIVIAIIVAALRFVSNKGISL